MVLSVLYLVGALCSCSPSGNHLDANKGGRAIASGAYRVLSCDQALQPTAFRNASCKGKTKRWQARVWFGESTVQPASGASGAAAPRFLYLVGAPNEDHLATLNVGHFGCAWFGEAGQDAMRMLGQFAFSLREMRRTDASGRARRAGEIDAHLPYLARQYVLLRLAAKSSAFHRNNPGLMQELLDRVVDDLLGAQTLCLVNDAERFSFSEYGCTALDDRTPLSTAALLDKLPYGATLTGVSSSGEATRSHQEQALRAFEEIGEFGKKDGLRGGKVVRLAPWIAPASSNDARRRDSLHAFREFGEKLSDDVFDWMLAYQLWNNCAVHRLVGSDELDRGRIRGDFAYHESPGWKADERRTLAAVQRRAWVTSLLTFSPLSESTPPVPASPGHFVAIRPFQDSSNTCAIRSVMPSGSEPQRSLNLPANRTVYLSGYARYEHGSGLLPGRDEGPAHVYYEEVAQNTAAQSAWKLVVRGQYEMVKEELANKVFPSRAALFEEQIPWFVPEQQISLPFALR